MMIEDYLGDGVYATYDGHTITLDLRAQDRFTRIALEPEVLDALIRFRTYSAARAAEIRAREDVGT